MIAASEFLLDNFALMKGIEKIVLAIDFFFIESLEIDKKIDEKMRINFRFFRVFYIKDKNAIFIHGLSFILNRVQKIFS